MNDTGLGTDINCTAWTKAYGSAGTLYTYALGAAAQRFYDEPALQRAFGIFWAAVRVSSFDARRGGPQVADRLRPLDNVVALELVNEPWYGDVALEEGDEGVDGWQLGQPVVDSAPSIERLHAALHESIRDVDEDTLLMFEPGAGGAAYAEPTGYTSGPGGAAYDDRQAFAYHVYGNRAEIAPRRAPRDASGTAQIMV